MKAKSTVPDTLLSSVSTGIVGTTFMTLFSYTLSALEDEQFIEPEILTTLFHRIGLTTSRRSSVVPGWAAHYAMGILFSSVYTRLWERHKLDPGFKNSLLLGSVSGMLGYLVWKLTIHLHPDPPAINYKKYYRQLLPAHLIFAGGCTLAYRVLKSLERSGE